MAKKRTPKFRDLEAESKALNKKYAHLPWIARYNKGNKLSTNADESHLLGFSHFDGVPNIYPTVIEENGKLRKFDTHDEAIAHAKKNKTLMPVKDDKIASYYSRQGLIKHNQDKPREYDFGIDLNPNNMTQDEYNAYNQQYGFGGWIQENSGTISKVMKGLGTAVQVIPGVGTAIGAGLMAGGMGMDVVNNNYQDSLANTALDQDAIRVDVLKAQQDNNEFALGGDLNGITQYNGLKHEQGGIPIGQNAEVEDGETRVEDYIYSDKLKPKGSKSTYAELSKKISKKYTGMENDRFSPEAEERELKELEDQQEAQKAENFQKDLAKLQQQNPEAFQQMMQQQAAQQQAQQLSPEQQQQMQQQNPQGLGLGPQDGRGGGQGMQQQQLNPQFALGGQLPPEGDPEEEYADKMSKYVASHQQTDELLSPDRVTQLESRYKKNYPYNPNPKPEQVLSGRRYAAAKKKLENARNYQMAQDLAKEISPNRSATSSDASIEKYKRMAAQYQERNPIDLSGIQLKGHPLEPANLVPGQNLTQEFATGGRIQMEGGGSVDVLKQQLQNQPSNAFRPLPRSDTYQNYDVNRDPNALKQGLGETNVGALGYMGIRNTAETPFGINASNILQRNDQQNRFNQNGTLAQNLEPSLQQLPLNSQVLDDNISTNALGIEKAFGSNQLNEQFTDASGNTYPNQNALDRYNVDNVDNRTQQYTKTNNISNNNDIKPRVKFLDKYAVNNPNLKERTEKEYNDWNTSPLWDNKAMDRMKEMYPDVDFSKGANNVDWQDPNYIQDVYKDYFTRENFPKYKQFMENLTGKDYNETYDDHIKNVYNQTLGDLKDGKIRSSYGKTDLSTVKTYAPFIQTLQEDNPSDAPITSGQDWIIKDEEGFGDVGTVGNVVQDENFPTVDQRDTKAFTGDLLTSGISAIPNLAAGIGSAFLGRNLEYDRARAEQYDPNFVDPTRAIQESRDQYAGAKDQIRQASRGAGNYMSNLIGATASQSKAQAGIQSQYDNINAGISNQAGQFNAQQRQRVGLTNAQIGMQEQMDKTGLYQNALGLGAAGLNTGIGNYVQSKQDANMMNIAGGPNFYYERVGPAHNQVPVRVVSAYGYETFNVPGEGTKYRDPMTKKVISSQEARKIKNGWIKENGKEAAKEEEKKVKLSREKASKDTKKDKK